MPDPSPPSWLSRHRLELAMALRMAGAGLVSLAVGEAIGLAQVYWAVLTAVIVTQTSLGGSLKAVADRFVGTLGGAAWGAAVAAVIPHQGLPLTLLAMAAALVPLGLLVAFRPGYRVAPVTAIIVLLGRVSSGGAFAAAADRVMEIGFGSVVALLLAMLVPPARAHRLLLAAAHAALAPTAEQVAALLAGIAAPLDAAAVLARHDRIRAATEKAATIAGEAAQERRSFMTGAPDPDPLVRALRRLAHDLVNIGRSLRQPLPASVAERLSPPAASLAVAIGEHLNGLGTVLAGAGTEPPPVTAAFEAFESALAQLRRDGVTRTLSDDEVERVFGLAFALEQFRRNLGDLAARAGEMRRERRGA